MLKKIFFLFSTFIIFFSLLEITVYAQDNDACYIPPELKCSCPAGSCDVEITCKTLGAFNADDTTYFNSQVTSCKEYGGTWVLNCYNVNITEDISAYIGDNPSFTPGGYDQLVCDYECVDKDNPTWGTDACVIEDNKTWCPCPADPNWTPTPTETPDPSSTPEPTPDTRRIQGNFYEYTNAGFVGNTCGGQATQTAVELANIPNIYAHLSGSNVQSGALNSGDNSKYTIDMSSSPTGNNWDVTVTLNTGGLLESEMLACGCPAAIDPSDPFTCQYSGIADDVSNIDFYLKPYLDNVSWFQTFGGNIFARENIRSYIPVVNCVADGTCEDSIIAKIPSSTNQLTSGFALTSGASANISTINSFVGSRSYINSSDRTDNLNAYATSVEINSYGYAFYANKLSGEIDISRPGGSLDLNEVRTDDNWVPGATNIIHVNGDLTIDETHNWDVQNGDSIVVLVNGNLNVSDAAPDAGLDQVISVAEGGFLAFFAANNIIFDESIGYSIDPAAPTIPAVTNATANIVGVFVADNILTVNAFEATDIPDRKFIGSGTFVGWTNIDLARDFDDGDQGSTLSSMQAVENFIFRPDFMANFPNELKVTNSNWRELNPQYLDQ